MSSRRRLYPAVIIFIVGAVWFTMLLQQYSLVDQALRDNSLSSGTAILPTKRQGDNIQPVARPDVAWIRPNRSNFSTLTRSKETAMFFNGYPLALIDAPPKSSARCLVESSKQFTNISWQFTSCQYMNLCFNMQTNEYEIIKDIAATSVGNENALAVAIGGINPRWDVGSGFDRGSHKVKWAPKVTTRGPSSFYQLPENVVMVPFNSFAGHNVGHLLWDDFFAMFRLLQLNGYMEYDNLQLLPIRQVLDEKLYATCDIRRNKRIQCMNNFAKFLPIMGVDPFHFSSHKKVNFSGSGWPKSQLICSQNAVAGLGLLTDHGKRDHGWEQKKSDERLVPHMLGKGRLFWDFRQFILQNMGLEETPFRRSKSLPQIMFSLESSRDWDRRLNFTRQIHALESAIPKGTAAIETHALWQMSLKEQVQLTLSSQIFVSSCGGGIITSTFLPRGASLIIFYNETGGLDFEEFRSNGAPARLDWDLLGNAAHLRVHWLPIGSMDSEDALNLFVQLIRHELSILEG